MKTFYLVVPGEPVGKARPRVTRFVTYTPKKDARVREQNQTLC